MFLAFPVPDALIAYVARIQHVLREDGVKGKWVRPESCHLTVVFLGEQDEGAAERLGAVLNTRCEKETPVRLNCNGLDTFGNPARVLFLDLVDVTSGRFADVARRVQTAVSETGIEWPDANKRREPRAHLTLARFRGRREAKSLRSIGTRERGEWNWEVSLPEPPPEIRRIELRELILYQSILHQGGAEYRELQRVALSGGH